MKATVAMIEAGYYHGRVHTLAEAADIINAALDVMVREMDAKTLATSGLIPATHVLMPVAVVDALVVAGSIVYEPAAYASGHDSDYFHNAARAAENVVARARALRA